MDNFILYLNAFYVTETIIKVIIFWVFLNYGSEVHLFVYHIYIFLFQINVVLLNYSSKKPKKNISEGSCNWSNDAKIHLRNHRNKLQFKIYSNRKQLF